MQMQNLVICLTEKWMKTLILSFPSLFSDTPVTHLVMYDINVEDAIPA